VVLEVGRSLCLLLPSHLDFSRLRRCGACALFPEQAREVAVRNQGAIGACAVDVARPGCGRRANGTLRARASEVHCATNHRHCLVTAISYGGRPWLATVRPTAPWCDRCRGRGVADADEETDQLRA